MLRLILGTRPGEHWVQSCDVQLMRSQSQRDTFTSVPPKKWIRERFPHAIPNQRLGLIHKPADWWFWVSLNRQHRLLCTSSGEWDFTRDPSRMETLGDSVEHEAPRCWNATENRIPISVFISNLLRNILKIDWGHSNFTLIPYLSCIAEREVERAGEADKHVDSPSTGTSARRAPTMSAGAFR